MTTILISSAMFVLNSMICFMFFRDFKFVFFVHRRDNERKEGRRYEQNAKA